MTIMMIMIIIIVTKILHLLSSYYIHALHYYAFNLHDKSVFPKYFLYNWLLQDVIDKQKPFYGEKVKGEIYVLAPT